METYRIVLADDHALIRQGMKAMINEADGLEVVGEAGDGFELLKLLKELHPDMAILDISMPGLQGIETTQEIKRRYPELIVLILTMHKNKEYLYHAISAGARGYLLKEDSDIELFSAIDAIRQGGLYISRMLADELAEDLPRLLKGRRNPSSELLSSRETQVLKMVAEGRTTREIAELLFLSPRTIENHRARIQKKLDLKSTVELIHYALKYGISRHKL